MAADRFAAKKYDPVAAEIASARRDAEGAAEVIKGIPIFNSIFWTLDRIARKLESAERLLEAESHG